MNIYDSKFYNTYKDASLNSANELVPIFIKLFNPQSVLDVGCGIGTWLKQFDEAGIHDYNGVEGPYVKKEFFIANKEKLIFRDLRNEINLNRKYDLVISLEVAEHIEPECADVFLNNLVKHSDTIIMSAAIPYQGGTFHVNEQWPEYWIDKMKKKGYEVYDILRPIIWYNSKIDYYYRQNVLLFSNNKEFQNYKTLDQIYSIVHPIKWLESQDHKRQSLKFLLKSLPYSIYNAIKNRI